MFKTIKKISNENKDYIMMKNILKLFFVINIVFSSIIFANDSGAYCYDDNQKNKIFNNYNFIEKDKIDKDSVKNTDKDLSKEIYNLQLEQSKNLIIIFGFFMVVLLMIFGFLKNKELSNIKEEIKEEIDELKERNKKILLDMHSREKYYRELHNRDLDLSVKKILVTSETTLNEVLLEFKKNLNFNLIEDSKKFTDVFINNINGQLKTNKLKIFKDEIASLRMEIINLKRILEEPKSDSILKEENITNKTSLNDDLDEKIENINFKANEKEDNE